MNKRLSEPARQNPKQRRSLAFLPLRNGPQPHACAVDGRKSPKNLNPRRLQCRGYRLFETERRYERSDSSIVLPEPSQLERLPVPSRSLEVSGYSATQFALLDPQIACHSATISLSRLRPDLVRFRCSRLFSARCVVQFVH